MEERGVNVDHATLNRWVIKYSPLIALAAKKNKRAVASSWRMDESVLQLSCIKDEGGPLGIALQEEISNHHKLH
jgi:transposase-like protein